MLASPRLLWLSLLELMLVPVTLTTGAHARCLLQAVAMDAASPFAC